ncbi:uncharacterized protein LOC111246705 isoform X3 [Varroa destructor]|uniref:Uncharacterized protein n=1 Tax=Varroa destructor TaxID=109461 RepID=A0A7M7JLY3_VARDE|nr:uncharacterized protein LOC111246705 isoform X3 [Varroa destructor]
MRLWQTSLAFVMLGVLNAALEYGMKRNYLYSEETRVFHIPSQEEAKMMSDDERRRNAKNLFLEEREIHSEVAGSDDPYNGDLFNKRHAVEDIVVASSTTPEANKEEEEGSQGSDFLNAGSNAELPWGNLQHANLNNTGLHSSISGPPGNRSEALERSSTPVTFFSAGLKVASPSATGNGPSIGNPPVGISSGNVNFLISSATSKPKVFASTNQQSNQKRQNQGTFVFSDTPEVTGSLADSGNNEDGGDSNSQTKPGGNEGSPIDEDECKDQTAEETTTISSTNKNGQKLPHNEDGASCRKVGSCEPTSHSADLSDHLAEKDKRDSKIADAGPENKTSLWNYHLRPGHESGGCHFVRGNCVHLIQNNRIFGPFSISVPDAQLGSLRKDVVVTINGQKIPGTLYGPLKAKLRLQDAPDPILPDDISDKFLINN